MWPQKPETQGLMCPEGHPGTITGSKCVPGRFRCDTRSISTAQPMTGQHQACRDSGQAEASGLRRAGLSEAVLVLVQAAA